MSSNTRIAASLINIRYTLWLTWNHGMYIIIIFRHKHFLQGKTRNHNDKFVRSSTSKNEWECSSGGFAADAFDFLSTKVRCSEGLLGGFIAVLSETVSTTVASLDYGTVRRADSTLCTRESISRNRMVQKNNYPSNLSVIKHPCNRRLGCVVYGGAVHFRDGE